MIYGQVIFLKKISGILLFTFLFTMFTPYTALCDDVSVSAQSAVVIDSQTGTVVYEKNCNETLKMASTTKIMTAICAIENGNLTEIVKITKEMVGAEGSSIYLKEGESLTLEDLLYGLMLGSGNDAAEAIAVYISGSVEKFTQLMNDTAKKIGLSHTCFENPSGLDGENHYTTALELAKLAQYAMQNETFKKIASTQSKRISGPDGVRVFTNHNKLLKIYDGANGIKTGYTKASGRCLVSSASRDGSEFITVTLNAPDDWDDHVKLFDYAFENFYTCTLIKKGPSALVVPVVGGICSNCCTSFDSDCKVTLKKDEDKPEVSYYLPRFVYAPVTDGRLAGYAKVSKDGECVGEVSISYTGSVDTNIQEKKSFFNKIISFLLEQLGLNG